MSPPSIVPGASIRAATGTPARSRSASSALGLAEPPVLARTEEHGAVVADEQRVVRVDRVRVAGLAAGDDHLGAGLLEELAQRLVLGGRRCRIGLRRASRTRASARRRPAAAARTSTRRSVAVIERAP